MARYTPMMEQYLAIKAQYQDAFLFFRLGDFYELFFEDAVLAARELEITLTGRDAGVDERIPMCGVPHHSVDNYLQILLRKGYKIAICEQVEDPKEAKGVVRREVVRVLTPGTVMEGPILLEKENNYLVAATTSEDHYALAACDISTGQMHAARFKTLEQLAGEIISYQPREILIQEGRRSEELEKLCSHLGGRNIQLIDGNFGQLDQQENQWVSSLEDSSLKQTINLLLNYINATQKRVPKHIQELDLYQAEKYMFMDPFSKRNLELMETVMEKNKVGSLLWYLDHTVTAMGARLIRKWMDKPLIVKTEIEERLDAVQYFVENMFIRQQLRENLKSVYDLERLAARVSYGNANAKDLINLKHSLLVVPQIEDLFLNEEGKIPSLMANMLTELDRCEDIVDLIERSIEEDPPLSLKDGGLIRDGFNDFLDKLKRVSREGKNWIAALEQQEREATGVRSLKIGYNKVFGYYIEVTKANLASVPIERYERKQTLANAERFVTPELKEQEALILDADEQLTDLEYKVFTEIREQVAIHLDRLQKLSRQVAALDVLSTMAQVAQEQRLVRPTITNQSSLHIREGRHPVVEKVLKEERFIANDTVMDQSSNRILLITGPNMAGKSTYMRQLALIVIMAQIGCFVPAKEAEIGITDRIFTRIGAADDLVGGQSTFMVEMKDIQLMTTQATPSSLVIIDEIGRGTSTHDGLSIAQAVIEYLQQTVGCKSIISTHFHELAILEESLEGLKNYHMAVEEKDNNVIFLRKLKRGATSESYGIYCAKVAGLPNEVIDRAQELLTSYREATPSAVPKPQDYEVSQQLDLFVGMKEPTIETDKTDKRSLKIIKELREIDLVNMTPLQAINYLYELKQKTK
ncbi:MAG TPA: DNA mismatch repair protein MutS [Bacillota bacterium]|nr:DNA mismatch repair protein MutS [Bacillota bacterium]